MSDSFRIQRMLKNLHWTLWESDFEFELVWSRRGQLGDITQLTAGHSQVETRHDVL